MVFTCKGKCDHEKNRARDGYRLGYRRCMTCNKFIKTNALRCYCCGTKLRTVSYRAKRIKVVVRY